MTKLTMKALQDQINELQTVVLNLTKELESKPTAKGRNYGPASTAKLTDIVAWRIKFGDRSQAPVKDNADFFGLSRGQVYSLDKYTFQHVNEESFTMDDVADIPVEVEEADEA